MKNKTIIITGAGSGVGKETATLFLKNNYNVAILGRNFEKLVNTASNYENALPIKCDISKPLIVEKAFKTILSKYGYKSFKNV